MRHYLSVNEVIEINAEVGYRLLFDDLGAYDWLIELYESGRVSKSNIEPWLRGHAEKI